MESSLVPAAEEVVTKCDMPWLKERMREYPVFTPCFAEIVDL
jgi:hypothetical protein